jgi:hypothetical protein
MNRTNKIIRTWKGWTTIENVPFYEALTNNQEFIESLKTYSEVFQYFKIEAVSTLSECENLHQDITKKMIAH